MGLRKRSWWAPLPVLLLFFLLHLSPSSLCISILHLSLTVYFAVMWLEPKTLHMLSNYSTIELFPFPSVLFLTIINNTVKANHFFGVWKKTKIDTLKKKITPLTAYFRIHIVSA